MITINVKSDSKRKTIRIILFIVSILAVIILFVLGYLYNSLGKFNTVKLKASNEELGIGYIGNVDNTPDSENIQESNNANNSNNITDNNIDQSLNNAINQGLVQNYESGDSIVNIALFGIDVGRNKDDPPHSDSIIIATLDKKHKKMKLTSVMRDTYVRVSGHGKKKITEAYAYGGPVLAIKTLNENFGLDIKNYVTVNFFSLEKVIDVLGGVEITVKDYEIAEINKWIKEISQIEGKNPNTISSAGTYRLNGLQAVAYSRMRKVGNGDFERSERQRKVLTQLYSELQSKGFYKYPYIASEVFPLIETSLTKADILSAGAFVVSAKITSVEQQRFPLDGYCSGETINSIWYLVPTPNISTTAKQIRDYIYDDVNPKPKKPLF